MGGAKKRRSESYSRRKKRHKKRNKSDVEDGGIKYLEHAGKEVNVVLGKKMSTFMMFAETHTPTFATS